MKQKNTYILIVVMAVLLIGLSVQRYLQLKEEDTYKEGRKLINADSQLVINKIEIKKGGTATILEKINGQWMVSSSNYYPAESELVEDTLKLATDASIISVVANSLDDADEYGLNDEQRTVVIFSSDNQVAGEITIGKSGTEPGNYYVIRKGSDKIVLAKEVINVVDIVDWRTKVIERIPQNEIQSVKINTPNNTFSLSQKDGEWFIDENIKAKQDESKRLIGNLQVIQATDFPPPDATFEDSKNSIEIQLTTGTRKLIFGQTTSDGKTFIKNSAGLVYLINETTKNNIFFTRGNLLAK